MDKSLPEGRPEPRGKNCDDLTEAAIDAEQELSRLEDIVEDTIMPTGNHEEGLNELIAEVDTGKASGELRQALAMDKKGSRRSVSNRRRFQRR